MLRFKQFIAEASDKREPAFEVKMAGNKLTFKQEDTENARRSKKGHAFDVFKIIRDKILKADSDLEFVSYKGQQWVLKKKKDSIHDVDNWIGSWRDRDMEGWIYKPQDYGVSGEDINTAIQSVLK